jgi:quercetin dioxygenase-like cupin family protein
MVKSGAARAATAVVLGLLCGASPGTRADTVLSRGVVVAYPDARFAAVDPARPEAAQVAVLRGDPATGPSTMLMRVAKGPGVLHHHTADYELVVIEGQMRYWAFGQTEEQAPALGPGSYWYQPGGVVHGNSCLSDTCLLYLTWSGKRDAIRSTAGR